MPSRKWWVALVTGLTGVAVMAATDGAWHHQETIALITVASARVIAWLLPNADDPPKPAVLEGRGRR